MTHAAHHTIRRCLIRFCVTAALPLFAAPPSELRAQGLDLQRRFESEAPAAWEKYKARVARLQGTMQFKQFRLTPERKLETDRRYEFKQKPRSALFMLQNFRTPLSTEEDGVLRVSNPDYAFELRRRAPSDAWVLTEISYHPERDLPFSDPYFNPAGNVESWLTYPINFSSIFNPLRIVALGPGYQATGFVPLEREGRECIKVDFTFTPDGSNPRTPTIKGFTIYSPQEYWVAKEHNVTMGWAGRKDLTVATVVRMEYANLNDGFPAIKRVLQKYDSVNLADTTKAYHGDWVYELDLAEGDVGDEIFTLSAYGLPEPPGRWKSRRYWFAGLALGGLLCLAVGVIVRRRTWTSPADA